MIDGLLTAVVRMLSGGRVKAPAKPLPEILYMPVLFANGRDDDGPALKAFWENQPFMFQGRVYEPSLTPKVLPLERVCFSAHSVVIRRMGKTDDVIGLGRIFPGHLGPKVLYVDAAPVPRSIYGAAISFGHEVRA